MRKLEGKVALITGGNSGIGLATAKLFQSHGAQLAITGRNQSSLEEAQGILGNDVLVLNHDVSSHHEIQAMMEKIRLRFGGLDIVYANAAIAPPAPFHMVTEEQFDSVVATNFKGTFFTLQLALPLMVNGGAMIVTTSITNQQGAPHFSLYGATKAAVRSLVRSLSLQLADKGIRINAISPGPIDTPMFERFDLPQNAKKAIRDTILQKSPSKRFGLPDEIAKVALFLASDDSSYITGDEIVVDGGMSQL